ncbi:hypothetical protein NDU88_002069 [Pleurodeles waltl]|uniref:Uncharacterized protein n=1 Tax=Pleurodeles waltl TaxID=8319 RepID=A0AAV7TJQ2_PLEWA|nr:hypothetical protein NDU88_002069 [Pleurodeles waltl]
MLMWRNTCQADARTSNRYAYPSRSITSVSRCFGSLCFLSSPSISYVVFYSAFVYVCASLACTRDAYSKTSGATPRAAVPRCHARYSWLLGLAQPAYHVTGVQSGRRGGECHEPTALASPVCSSMAAAAASGLLLLRRGTASSGRSQRLEAE